MGTVGRRLLASIMLLASYGVSPGGAAELRLGIAVEPSSLDPHFQWFGASIAVARQIFEPLVTIADDGTIKPLLATSWEPAGATAWRFQLRPEVRFSDGAALTPEDVAFTFTRARNVPNSPTGFGPALRQVELVEAEGPHTILVHTKGPAPMLPKLLSAICIVSRHAGEGATTADYNITKAAIGTGPFRVTGWERGGGVTLVRNDRYWGARPEWDSVRIRYIPNAGARLAALLAGDVDLIDQVAGTDVATVKQNPALRLASSISYAIVAFLPDVTQRAPPFITGNDGAKLAQNPLADLRVRRALDLAINREAMKQRVMNDQVIVATQIMLPGQFGYDETRPPPAFDPIKARALLSEAGYPDGFHMSIHCQLRFYNAEGLCQAIAQMFTRVGVRTEPVPMPHPIYVAQSMRHEFSFGTAFTLVDFVDPSNPLISVNATYGGGAEGWGNGNRGRYSNPALDELLRRSEVETDPATRLALLKQATQLSLDDEAFMPLFRPLNVEAMRAGFSHQPAADGYVLAADVHRSETAAR